MAKITKIKAHDPSQPKEEQKELVKTAAKKEENTPKIKVKPAKSEAKPETKSESKKQKNAKKPFILFRPFLALGRYIRDSWHEIRQVRWPSRKSTWGMVLAVFIYAALIMAIIVLLDTLFNLLTNLIFA